MRVLLLTEMGLEYVPVNLFWLAFSHCAEFKVFGSAILSTNKRQCIFYFHMVLAILLGIPVTVLIWKLYGKLCISAEKYLLYVFNSSEYGHIFLKSEARWNPQRPYSLAIKLFLKINDN